MAAIRGAIKWGKVPLWYGGSDMENQQVSFRMNNLISANLPMIYQIVWTTTTGGVIDEMYVPTVEGDVVNVIFKIYATTQYPTPTSLPSWELLGEIKKSRDVPNTNIVNGTIPNSQRFTVDISRVVADQLSYSLVPIGKGSWENQEYGGMNGGEQKQDNVTEAINPYHVTQNGTYRAIVVKASIEMLDSTGAVVTSSTVSADSNAVRAINSVPSYSSNTYNNQMRTLDEWGASNTSPRLAMTNCPNHSTEGYIVPAFIKSVNPSSLADFLYFYVQETFDGYNNTDWYNLYEVYGQAYNYGDSDGNPTGMNFVLGSNWKNSLGTTHVCSDISHNFIKETGQTTIFQHFQSQVCVQNVSPAYINTHAYAPQDSNYPYTSAISPITANTSKYRLHVRGNYDTNVGGPPTVWQANRHSSVYWYSINREDNSDANNKQLFQNVTFHWLNTVGGIDTYTARRDIVESISSNKSIMETKLPDRFYQQDNATTAGNIQIGSYYNDSMRGFDTYRGGSEVLSVSAKINNSAYTEPLGSIEAKWLREIFQSPNVWVEEATEVDGEPNYQSDAPYHINSLNPTLRPQPITYKPIIITNSEAVSLDQQKGLVMYNIEYTHSQAIPTQRN